MRLKYPCTAHAFFSERLPNHCQVLHRTFSRSAQNSLLLVCQIRREIALSQVRGSIKRT
jgi:hypothetical protein